MNKINILNKVNQFKNEIEYIEVHSYLDDPIEDLKISIENGQTNLIATIDEKHLTNDNVSKEILTYMNGIGFEEFAYQDIENFDLLNHEEQQREMLDVFLTYAELYTIGNKLYCDFEF